MIKKIAIFGACFLCLVIGGITFINIRLQNVNNAVETNKSNKTNEPELYTVPTNEKIFINGVILPTQSKEFFYEGDKGEIEKINVSNNTLVKKGDLLYTYKNPSLIEELNSLKASLSSKKNNLKDAFEEEKSIINTEIAELNNQIANVTKNIYFKVYAPFEGKIYIDNSEFESSNQSNTIMSLQSTDFYVKGAISEQDLPKLKLNQTTQILVFSTNEKHSGFVSYISDRPTTSQSNIDVSNGPQSFSYYNVSLKFDNNENLINGFHVQSIIDIDSTEFKVPSTSIFKENDKSYVYKKINDNFEKQEVIVSSTSKNFIVISSGLNELDTISKYADSISNVEGVK